MTQMRTNPAKGATSFVYDAYRISDLEAELEAMKFQRDKLAKALKRQKRRTKSKAKMLTVVFMLV